MILPPIDDDHEDELNVGEEDVKELRQQLDYLHSSCDNRGSIQSSAVKESCEADLLSEDEIHGPEETEIEEIDVEELLPEEDIPEPADDLSVTSKSLNDVDPSIRKSISISSCRRSSILQEPTLSESPKIGNNPRKSMTFSSTLLASQKNASESSESEVSRHSLRYSEHIRSSLRSSKVFSGPTESLAASLQRGLQIIDHQQRSSASTCSSVEASFEHLMLKPCPEADKTSASVQTLPYDKQSSDGSSTPLLCSSCQRKFDNNNTNGVQDSLKTWIVAVDNQQADGKTTVSSDLLLSFKGTFSLFMFSFLNSLLFLLLLQATSRDLAKATEREKELENVCTEQAAKIEQLNHLVIILFTFFKTRRDKKKLGIIFDGLNFYR